MALILDLSKGNIEVICSKDNAINADKEEFDSYLEHLNEDHLNLNGSEPTRFVLKKFLSYDAQTAIKNAQIGDTAVLIGSQGKETITAEEIAARTGTISYEVVCNINGRVPRIYTK